MLLPGKLETMGNTRHVFYLRHVKNTDMTVFHWVPAPLYKICFSKILKQDSYSSTTWVFFRLLLPKNVHWKRQNIGLSCNQVLEVCKDKNTVGGLMGMKGGNQKTCFFPPLFFLDRFS